MLSIEYLQTHLGYPTWNRTRIFALKTQRNKTAIPWGNVCVGIPGIEPRFRNYQFRVLTTLLYSYKKCLWNRWASNPHPPGCKPGALPNWASTPKNKFIHAKLFTLASTSQNEVLYLELMNKFGREGGHRTHQTMFPKHSCLKPWSLPEIIFFVIFVFTTMGW